MALTHPVNATERVTLVYAAELPLIKNIPYGSYAHLASLITQTRQQQDNTVFLFGGGSLAPSMLSSFDRGAHIIDILNSLEPDAMAVAKREFSYFEDELSLRAYEAAFPVILSNVTDPITQRNLDGLDTRLLLEKGNVKIGVITVIDHSVVEEYLLQRLTIHDPLTVIKQEAAALREQGANLIILMVSHAHPFITDLLNQSIVDVTFRNDPHYVVEDNPDNPHPASFVTVNKEASAAIVNVSWPDGLSAAPAFEISQVALNTYQPLPAITEQIDTYDARITTLLSEQITTLNTSMNTQRSAVRTGENGFGNLVSDALREASHTDVALFNGGGIRGARIYKAGHVLTRQDISTEIPFRNHIRVLKIAGADIRAALENGVSQIEEASGRFPHVSGMKFQVNMSRPPGQRVENLTVGDQPLSDSAVYTLATSDYLSEGGDGYDALKKGEHVPFSQQVTPLIADIVISVLRRQPTLSARPSGRITLIEQRSSADE